MVGAAIVARYFFNVHDGVSGLDEDGVDLPDITTARAEGLSLAGQVIREAAATGCISNDWHLEVKDDTGLTLFRMDFHVAESPIVSRAFPAFSRWRHD